MVCPSSRATLLLLLTLSASTMAAEPETSSAPPNDPKPSRASQYRKLSPEAEERFKSRVAVGDRALEAGRLNEAADAYSEALSMKHDPRLSGRLGLVLSMFLPDPRTDLEMAFALQVAVSEAAGISSAERRQFFEAYERVRRRVCRLDVMTSDVDAMISIGSDKRVRSEGAFWTFISPGETKVTATLSGREDLKQTAECVGGKSMLLQFEFPEPAQAQPQVITIEKEPKERRVVVRENGAHEKVDPASAPRGRGLFSAEGGATLVVGALPSPAMGASLAGWYRREAFSVMAGVRGVWSVGPVEARPIDAFLFSGLGGPCVSWKWLDTCVLASLNVIQYEMADTSLYLPDRESEVIPGVGIGVGARYKIAGPFSVRLFGDVSSMLRQTSISIRTSDSATPVWSGGRFMASAGVTISISQ
ncbi:hypothetical protein QHF89_35560 [Polyangium sorediatum]|uniref:Tetratricopeptide repeat protein n=2 Tax=Polyangium sorediatum TaxID=889274 RepID=A0ABT6P2U7_9BACT|nr:hypothetical protein [Polyangium sorediatum]